MAEILRPAHYVYRKSVLLENSRRIQDAFRRYFDDFVTGYSFKTNSCAQVLGDVYDAGLYAEVVSPEEYALAKRIGYAPDHIIYNGVCKTYETLGECASCGGMVNADSLRDIVLAAEYAKEHGTVLPMGVRLNFDVGNGIASRFGFSGESFLALLEDSRIGRHVELVGLHCHFSHARSVESWKARAVNLCRYAAKLHNLRYLDFGGNMHALSDGDFMHEYASVIHSEVSGLCGAALPRIIIECGTPLVHEAFSLCCNVTDIKEGFVFTDCSASDLGIHADGRNLRMKVLRNECITDAERVPCRDCRITGYTCMENDVLKKGFNGKLAVGDRLEFLHCGDYSYAWANHFIKPPLEIVRR